MRREIERGALPAGSRLPPVRALEKQLGLSKNTAHLWEIEMRRALTIVADALRALRH